MKKEKTIRKNNRSVKSMIILFGAVLVTTSLLGGVLAKYTTEIGQATDKARVAHWGLTEQAEQDLNIFDTRYDRVVDEKDTVVSKVDTENVIAPGTEGDVIIYPSIDPDELLEVETAFKVVYASTGGYVNNEGSNWKVKKETADPSENIDWHPLVITISVVEYNSATDTYSYVEKYTSNQYAEAVDGDAINTDLNAALASSSPIIYPEDIPASFANEDAAIAFLQEHAGIKIEWSWPFESTGAFANADYLDTQLGNKFINDIDPEFTLNMTYTAVQED